MAEVKGRIDIVVMKDGKAPMQVEGISEWDLLNVLSSELSHVNARMAGKPMLIDEKTKKRLYDALANIFGTQDGFPMLNALAWCFNRIAKKMERDKTKNEGRA